MDLNYSDFSNCSCKILVSDIEKRQWDVEEAVFHKIQTFVLVTFSVFALQLGFRMKRFAYGIFRLFAWISYLLVPVLLSYILGLLGHQGYKNFHSIEELRLGYTYAGSVWAVMLFFAYAGFDHLTAFSVHEGAGRSKLVIQFIMQFVLILLLIYTQKILMLPILCIFLIVCFKFFERVVALGHASGTTPRIKRELTRVIEFMTHEDDKEDIALDPATMRGFNYLVGTRYSTVDKDKRRIVGGITLEKVWGYNEDGGQSWLLSSQGDLGGYLKDTCLSFSLFWLLLGKFRGYPLYKKENGSRMKAWKLVRDGLLRKEGGHERVFRVIEVELAFLQDYFHSKYIFFYLNGFYWKLIILAFPIMVWWFTQKSVDFVIDNAHHALQLEPDSLYHIAFYAYRVTRFILMVGVSVLEVAQLVALFTSRWFKVMLLCYYVKVKSGMSSSPSFSCGSFLLEMIGALYRGPSWFPHWKRELQQYSLVQSCTSMPKGPRFMQSVAAYIGIPFPKPGKEEGDSVELSEQVKEAVVTSLWRMDGPKLSKNITSLRRNGLDEELSSACNIGIEKDAEIILVWHIATSYCELHPYSQENKKDLKLGNSSYMAATSMSKYCAYLLAFTPSLTPISGLETESIWDAAIEEAREFFSKRKSVSEVVVEGAGVINKLPCTSEKYMVDPERYKMMEEIELDKEVGDRGNSMLKKGASLGKELTKRLGIDRGEGWEVMVELWAEMTLFLAQSNGNEMAHAEKLAEGGEFITHLWALLIHAGIEKLPTT